MKTISRIEFIRARTLSPILNNAVIGLDKLTDEHLGTNGEIAALKKMLLERQDEVKQILTKGESQEQSRNQKLLSWLNTQCLVEIPQTIQKIETDLKNRIESYDFQLENYQRQGKSAQQISILCPPITESDKQTASQRVEDLKSDLKAIQSFIGDSPEYRLSLLPSHVIESYNEYAKAYDYPLAEEVTEAIAA